MKKILNYIIIFICTMLILFLALAVFAKIPRSAIEPKLTESLEFYKKRAGIYKFKNKRIYSYIHYYADARKLNILYCIDSDHPIESILWARYYQRIKLEINDDFVNLVKNNEESNSQYLRYWNGCILILRPLLTIFNMEQIYLINKVVLSILALALIIILFKKLKKLAFIFLFTLILVASWYVPFCIEYSVTFYIMFIASMIAIKIDINKKNKTKEEIDEKLSKLFLITGIVTTFFDFLTTELLTIFVPLIFILIIRREENRLGTLKDTFNFVIKLSILWFVGYCCMWFAKWILASLILRINAFEYVKDNLILRINGLHGLSSYEKLYKHVIERNILGIPLIYFIHIYFYKFEVKIVLVFAIALVLIFINWKELKNKKNLLVLIFIAIMPYIRYLILANHSYRHAIFTFRDQIITIMAILYIIIDCLNYKVLLKKISITDLLKHNKKYT